MTVDNRGVLDDYLSAKELLNNGVPPGSIARLGRPIPNLSTQRRTPHVPGRAGRDVRLALWRCSQSDLVVTAVWAAALRLLTG